MLDYCKGFAKNTSSVEKSSLLQFILIQWQKTVIKHKFYLENAFQEILYMLDACIKEGSGSIVESVESQYINTSTYRPLSGSSYMKKPIE